MLVTVSIASYRTWINEYLGEPERRHLASAALDAYERIEDSANLSAEELGPIVDAATCRFVRVWEIGADLLNRLAVRHHAAQNAIRRMLHDRKADVRFHAIALLGSSPLPRPFAASLIRLGLHDRSNEVRGKAAEAACQLGLTELIAELEASLAEEKHPIARRCLEFAVALLCDGYLVQKADGKVTNVWVRGERDRGWCVSVPMTEDDLRSGQLETIIESAKGEAVEEKKGAESVDRVFQRSGRAPDRF
jgi:hypothetical protein